MSPRDSFGRVGRGWVSCRQLVLLIMVFSARFGEAQNAGPSSSQVLFLGACNPTGLNAKQELAASLPAQSLFAVSETHLRVGNCVALPTFIAGHPAPLRARRKVVGSHPGVGILTDFPARAAPHSWSDVVWKTSRVQVASVFVHSLWVLAAVVYVYGFPTSRADAVTLLEEVTQRVVFEGDGPRIIAGDFNLEVDQNPCVGVWESHGFVDVQTLHHRLGGFPATLKGVQLPPGPLPHAG